MHALDCQAEAVGSSTSAIEFPPWRIGVFRDRRIGVFREVLGKATRRRHHW
jgi:hypothetical protein